MENKKLEFPSDLKIIYNYIENDNLTDDINYTVINYVDVNCGICFKLLKDWQSYYETGNLSKDVKVIFITKGYSDIFEYYFNQFTEFPFNVLVDEKLSFININKIDNLIYKRTILLDKNNEILVIGNPFENEDIMKFYIKQGVIVE